ncbi:hypothetical protein AAG570_008619 [Ranatra chinensis]|uniref:BHLH domain-containing protein n=1 Tax=Ranatra chinensis TaxID=642074 RepID=A0ABD0YRH2_9HEMI
MDVDACNSQDQNNNSPASEKCYSLRPRVAIVRRGDEERPKKSSSGGARRKQKPAPLSKYRRKTANARERSRMREINEAFDSLRRAVPGGGEPEKLTKITTLKLAMKYIAALSQALNGEQPQPASTAPHPVTTTSEDVHYFQFHSPALPLTPPSSEKSSEELDPSRCLDLADLREHCLTPTDFTDFGSVLDFEDFFIT